MLGAEDLNGNLLLCRRRDGWLPREGGEVGGDAKCTEAMMWCVLASKHPPSRGCESVGGDGAYCSLESVELLAESGSGGGKVGWGVDGF